MVKPEQKEALGVGHSPLARLWQSKNYSWWSQGFLLSDLTAAGNTVPSEMHLDASGWSTTSTCNKNKHWCISSFLRYRRWSTVTYKRWSRGIYSSQDELQPRKHSGKVWSGISVSTVSPQMLLWLWEKTIAVNQRGVTLFGGTESICNDR